MEVAIPQNVISSVYELVVARNAAENPFSVVFGDYQVLLRQCRELQIRNGQLDKEARELRVENTTLQESVEHAKHAAMNSEMVRHLEAKGQEMQEELTSVYKEKGRLAEELVGVSRQLQVVRENNEAQGRALDDAGGETKRLKQRVKELADALDAERDARTLATAELQERLLAKEAAEAKSGKLEAEVTDLSRRLVELKMTEIERMNEVNRQCEEMLQNARNMEKAALAEREALSSVRDKHPLKFLTGSAIQAAASGMLQQVGGAKGARLPPPESPVSVIPEHPLRHIHAHEGGCHTVVFDRTGGRVATGGADKVVRLWDGATGAPAGVLHGMLETVNEVAFTCDQKALLAAGSDHALRMWDIASSRVRHTLTGHTARVSTVDCSPTEPTRAVSAGADRCVKTWDLRNGYCVATSPCHSACSALRYTVDGALVVSGHHDGALRFWDVRLGKVVHELQNNHNGNITSVAVSRNGGLVLTCGRDHMLKLVDIRSFQLQAEMRAPAFTVSSVWCRACLGPDDQYVAAGSSDGTVFVWEAKGHLAKTIRAGAGHAVLVTAWSPQGTPLVTGDKHGGLTFWQGG